MGVLGAAGDIDLSIITTNAPLIVAGVVGFTALAATIVVAKGSSRLALGWLRKIFSFGR